MAESLKRLWKFLNTDIGDVFSAETAKGGIESAKAVLELAKTLKEQGSNIGQLAPLVGQITTLLDVLNSPLVQVVGSGLPFVSIATGLLTFYMEKSKQEPTLALCVALVSQGAYLESLKAIMVLPENELLLEQIGKMPVSKPIEKQIAKLGELELDDAEAKKAVVCFHESKLAEKFNEVLAARLQDAGLDTTEAQTLTQRVAWNTARYINQVIADAADKVKPLAELYRTGGRELLEKYQSIDTYLEQQIATKPLETVFGESFRYKDIYVQLKGKCVNQNDKVNKKAEEFGLETWAKTMLKDSQKQTQVMFIQGGPGRGKSVFCRMFANWVRQHLHPIWTPILIRLRDIRTFEKNLETTLRAAVNADFAKSDDGWLTDRNTRFLFLLDGFDELLMERRTSEGLKEFLQQVGQFQRDCQQSQEMGHRVLITGRSLALHGMERLMPANLERVEIMPMDDKIQQQWLRQWEVQVGTDKTRSFKQFLQDKCCPKRVQELAQEPLLLYLLAAMHRDGELTVEMFKNASGTTGKILIYEKSLDWVLTKQRPELLNRELTEQDTEDLRRILTEAGLCVVQSGGECASVTMIEERLKGDSTVKALLEEARERLKDNPLRNALAAFYLQPAAGGKEGAVEFAHKSFGEFLCAERLKESLENWTKPGKRGRGFNVPDEQMHWEIYDLLGYGRLTPEIVGYLIALLKASLIPLTQEKAREGVFHPVQLFQRLEDFYFRWSEGEFIDIAKETLPQKKVWQLQKQGIQLGQRQVDVYTGLNVMILLLALNYYAQFEDELKDKIAFYPCDQKNTKIFHGTQLFRMYRIISYSECVGINGFLKTVGPFLSGTDLSGAFLSGAFLSGADLSNAKLCDTKLYGARLSSTNLSNANLTSADLRCADLSHADLSDANLSDANLSYANLSYANLINANLSYANLSDAYLIDVNLGGVNLSGVNFIDVSLGGINLGGINLSGANLSGVNLSGVNLSGVNLSGANLSDANLGNANLSNADLSDAYLSHAYLSHADLSDAYLSHADLSYANLSGVNLSDADLSDVNLSDANLSGTSLGNIIWDKKTRWEHVQGLDTADNVPDALKQKFGLG